ncbi:MAG: serine O-acetyltransferase [Elusimicrobiales bacterium]
MINFILFGLEITIQCEIGPGLIFPHTQGIVIGSVKIGENALIYNGVTIGAKKMDVNFNPSSRPIIGNNVMIGSGAKILGSINIGDNVIIGANSVVTKSVPNDKLVLGIPAKEYSKSES